MRTKKRFPVFYIIYFVCIAIVLAAVHYGLGIVKEYLADYESAQPQYEAERVFNEYYTADSFDDLVNLCDVTLSPYETKDAVSRYLTEFTKDKKITYSAITTGLDTSVRYIVKADDIKFSSFTLKESDKKTDLGFTLYEVADFELYCSGNESARVTAPKGYLPYVNGVMLDASSLTGEEARDKTCDFMPDGVEGIVYQSYAIDGLYFAPTDVSATTADGRDCNVRVLDDGSFYADILYDDTLAAAQTAYVTEAAQAIAKYMQNDAYFYVPAAYIDPDSELYENVRTSLTYFAISHVSYSFEDTAVTEFYRYDENTFSCRVSFTHVLKYSQYSGLDDYKDYIDTTYFFRRVGDKFLMYDRYNH